MVSGISFDAYPFFGFLRPDRSLWGYRNRCFLAALCCLIVRRPNLKVTTKRLLHQQVKYHGSFSSMFTHRSTSLQLFLVMWIFLRSLGVIQQMSSHWVSQKLFPGFKLKELWPYYQQHVNQIILNCTFL